MNLIDGCDMTDEMIKLEKKIIEVCDSLQDSCSKLLNAMEDARPYVKHMNNKVLYFKMTFFMEELETMKRLLPKIYGDGNSESYFDRKEEMTKEIEKLLK